MRNAYLPIRVTEEPQKALPPAAEPLRSSTPVRDLKEKAAAEAARYAAQTKKVAAQIEAEQMARNSPEGKRKREAAILAADRRYAAAEEDRYRSATDPAYREVKRARLRADLETRSRHFAEDEADKEAVEQFRQERRAVRLRERGLA